jgi:hypothetical protein
MSELSTLSKDLVNRKTFYVIYLLAFLSAFHFALPLYIESSFIEGIMGNLAIEDIGRYVGMVFAVSSLITFITFLNISKILRRIGNFTLAFSMIAIEVLALLGLALSDSLSPLLIIAIFAVHLIVVNIIFFNLDLFLESFSDDESTGTIRGIFLTAMNIAFVIAPFIAGLILTDGDFWKIFLAAAFIMTPTLILIYIRFRDYVDPQYDNVPFIQTIREIWRRKNVYKIMMSALLLRFFYSWMVIYTPIYLHIEMGIPFSEIVGFIMPIALLPFMLFEYILGKIADTKLGEKELLTIGFIIMGITTASITLVDTSNILIWAGMLFMTRVGATFVEMMTETYFYKKIDATDTHLIGYFKNLRPLSYLIAPTLATAVLVFLDYKYLFLILGIIMFFGIRYSLTIEDTR